MKYQKIFAIVFLIIATIFFVYRVIPKPLGSGIATSAPQSYVGIMHTLGLDQLELTPRESLAQDMVSTRQQLRVAINASLSEHPVRSQSRLEELIIDRLSLYIDPDFDRYLHHIESVSGQKPNTINIEIAGQPLSRERWELIANNIFLSTDPTTIFLFPAKSDGGWPAGGSIATIGCSHGRYSNLPTHNPQTDVVYVAVPADMRGLKGSYRGLLVLGFAWDRTRQRWVPLVSGAAAAELADDDAKFPPWF